ncbi:Ulp1 peptidase [Trifolium repens]|nr:Ulp1 peptidase [Trifolium repens]
MITGLPIDGEPVSIDQVTKEECLELVGIPPSRDNRLSNTSLVKIIEKINDTSSQREVEQACRATALLGINCTVIQAIGKSSIHMKYLSIFKDVDKIKSYAWGAASWANLIDSLKKPDASNIVGCTMALMIFAFLRMPQLVSLCYKKRKNLNSSSVKALTMAFQEACVIWRPYLYVEVGNQYESQKHIAKSITYVLAREITILHRPDLVPRQLFEGEPNQELIQNWVNFVIESTNPKSVWETRRERLVSEVLNPILVADEGIENLTTNFPTHSLGIIISFSLLIVY